MIRTSAITDYGKYAEDVTNSYMQTETDNREYNEIKERRALQREISKCKADYPKHQPPQKKTHKEQELVIDGKIITKKEFKAMWLRAKAKYAKEHAKSQEQESQIKETAKTQEKTPKKENSKAYDKGSEKKQTRSTAPLIRDSEIKKEKKDPVMEVPSPVAMKNVEKVKAIEETMIIRPTKEILKEKQANKEITEEKPSKFKVLSRATIMKNQMAYRDSFEEELFGNRTQEKTAKKSLVLHRRIGKGYGQSEGR